MDIAREAWNHGYESGRLVTDARNSIEAFGAIRRAAEIARWYDREAVAADDAGLMWDSLPMRDRASGARRAIRAAIGSDKA